MNASSLQTIKQDYLGRLVNMMMLFVKLVLKPIWNSSISSIL